MNNPRPRSVAFCVCGNETQGAAAAHQALQVIQSQTVKTPSTWVLEVDIRNFFETPEHSQLRDIVRQRVREGVLLRLIGKWLNADVKEDGIIEYPDAGTPHRG